MADENKIVGLDIGTTKIAVIISETDESGQPQIIGIGTSPSEGLKRGVVINLEKTVESVASAVEDAEMMTMMTMMTIILISYQMNQHLQHLMTPQVIFSH